MCKKLKEFREKRGLTQAAVADFIGISRQMYNKYENGEVEPSVKAVKALCTLYAVSYEELLGKADSSEKEAVYSIPGDFSGMCVSSPEPVYGAGGGIYGTANGTSQGVYGTANVLNQIMELLPRLLYAEKAKLLTTVAQSMSNDVEAGKLAAKVRPERLNHAEPEVPDYETAKHAGARFREYAAKIHFNSNGIKWTREDMHER